MIEMKFNYFPNNIPNVITLSIADRRPEFSTGEIIFFKKNEKNQWSSEFGPFDNKLINYLIEYGYITISLLNQVALNTNIYCHLQLTPKALLELI